MSKLNLLPCPFCGRVPPDPSYWRGGNEWSVGCHWDCPSKTVSDDPKPVVKAWNTRPTPKLPRVSPENLVEGEWYVFNYHQKFIPMLGKTEIFQGKFRIMDSFNSSKWSWANSQIEIWGPISFELEGDA